MSASVAKLRRVAPVLPSRRTPTAGGTRLEAPVRCRPARPPSGRRRVKTTRRGCREKFRVSAPCHPERQSFERTWPPRRARFRRPAEAEERERFCQQLPHEPPAAGAQCRHAPRFAAARHGPRAQQRRTFAARDDEYEDRGARSGPRRKPVNALARASSGRPVSGVMRRQCAPVGRSAAEASTVSLPRRSSGARLAAITPSRRRPTPRPTSPCRRSRPAARAAAAASGTQASIQHRREHAGSPAGATPIRRRGGR